jgi:hypothetical protein
VTARSLHAPRGGDVAPCRWGAAGLVSAALASCTVFRNLDYLGNGGNDADAATDARAPGDGAAAGSWCQRYRSDASLCADFDEESLTNVFERLQVGIAPPYVDGGNASLIASDRSPPGAFQASVPAVPGGVVAYAHFEQPVEVVQASSASLEFDMRLPRVVPMGDVDLASLFLESPAGGAPARAYLALSAGRGMLYVDIGTATDTKPDLGLPSDGNWHTYRLAVDLAQGFAARLSIDLKDVAVASIADAFSRAPFATFYLGLEAHGTATALDVAYDNVVFTAQ